MCMCDPSSFARTPAELRRITRRHFFSECGVGVGKMALASLVFGGWSKVLAAGTASPATQPGLAPGAAAALRNGLHFAAKAKHVIYMFQAGAPSQLDLFDYKP